jgi:cobalt-zinc-cadmium efflux system membrane fusion protein
MSALLLASCGKTPKTGALTGDVTEESHAHGGEITLTEAQMKAVDIRLGRIEQRELNSVVRVNGQLTLDPQKKAEITSLVGGIIRQVLVTEGKYVSAGQAVAWLENTEIVELQKNYLTLKKESLVAEQEYNRQKELSAQGAGVEKTLQQASASHEISKAQLTGLEQQLRQISINPEQVSGGSMVTQIPVKSPIAGYVNKINISTGSYVDMQTSLMRITDNSGIHCDVKVFEKDVNRVRTGQEVDIILTNQPDIRLKGFIYDVNKSFEDDTRAVIAHIALKEKTDTELIPGMYVTGLINAGRQKTDALPNEAIVSKDGKKYIFVLEEEENGENGRICHFEQVEVITGVSELGYTQITFADKPHEDMTVVISNAFYIGSMSSDHGEHGH